MENQFALPRKTVERIASSWFHAIKQKESGSVVNIPLRDQLYRLNDFLNHPEILQKIGIDTRRIQIIPLHATSLPIEDPEELTNFIQKKIENGKSKLIIIIVDADVWMKERPELISTLDLQTHQQKPSISCLYLFQSNITSHHNRKSLRSNTSLFQNLTYFQYFNRNDMTYFVNFLEDDYRIQIPINIKKDILKKCGGCMWLIREAVRYYAKHKSADEIFTHPEMKFRLQVLFEELAKPERLVVEKIIQRQFDFTIEEKEPLLYLLNTNLIAKQRKKYELTIPLLEDHIQNLIIKKQPLRTDEKYHIYLDTVPIDSLFTSREKKLLRYFIEHANTVITRDEVGTLLWQNSEEEYSDWSLDMIISRFRNKIQKLGYSRDKLKTVKNKGFIFSN